MDWPHTRARFLTLSKDGPTTPCHICDQLFFKEMMTQLKQGTWARYSGMANIGESTLPTTDSIPQVCGNCLTSVKEGNLPKFCALNGMSFPNIPPPLQDLREIEERLISPRIFVHDDSRPQIRCEGT